MIKKKKHEKQDTFNIRAWLAFLCGFNVSDYYYYYYYYY